MAEVDAAAKVHLTVNKIRLKPDEGKEAPKLDPLQVSNPACTAR